MTAAKGKPANRRTKDYEQEERPFDPGERVEAHRRTTKHRVPKQVGKPSSRRAGASARGERPVQGKLPFSSGSLMARMRPERFTRRLIQVGIGVLILLLTLAVLMVVYSLSHGMKLFTLQRVEVQGNLLLSRDEIEESVKMLVDKGVLRADLALIRSTLKRNELIEEAEVTRLLPDMLRVTIKERAPYALSRRSDGTVVCVDRAGAMFGSTNLFKIRPLPPLINGLKEEGEDATAFNRQRLLAYQQLLADLDRGEPHLSPRIDEVYFDDIEGVRVILADSQTAVYLGKEDYRRRLNAALDVLDAVERKDLEALNVLRIGDAEKLVSGVKIAYLNAMVPKRVIVGLDE